MTATPNVHQSAVETFSADTAAGRISPVAHAELADGRARVTGGPFSWDVDLPGVIGGGNQAPSPTAYLLGALAACAVAYTADTLAPEFGVTISSLSADARCTTDLAGLVGLEGRDPRLTGLTLEITLAATGPDGAVEAMQAAWRERCPVFLVLTEASDVQVRWQAA